MILTFFFIFSETMRFHHYKHKCTYTHQQLCQDIEEEQNAYDLLKMISA